MAQHFSGAEKKNCQQQSLYPVKLFFRNEWEIRTYSDKRKQKEFVTRKPPLKEWLNKSSKEEGNDNKKRLETSERRTAEQVNIVGYLFKMIFLNHI